MLVLVIRNRARYSNGCSMNAGHRFDHEKLDVYQTSLEFVRFVNDLVMAIPAVHRNAREQLIRACQSIPLNIVEGNGKRSSAERRRFLEIARGSAMECAAVLDVLVTVGATSEDHTIRGKDLLVRIVAMLSKMTAPREEIAREDGAEYSTTSRIEYDDEHEHDGRREQDRR